MLWKDYQLTVIVDTARKGNAQGGEEGGLVQGWTRISSGKLLYNKLAGRLGPGPDGGAVSIVRAIMRMLQSHYDGVCCAGSRSTASRPSAVLFSQPQRPKMPVWAPIMPHSPWR